MPWGKPSPGGGNDLVDKLKAGKASLFVLSFRTFGAKEATAVAKALQSNTTLQEFHASGHDIGTAGAEAFGHALAANSTLQRLCIGHDKFGDAALRALVESGLMHNKGLLKWDLELKGLSPASGVYIGRVLQVHPTLQELALSRNALGDAGVQALADGYAKRDVSAALTTLDLSDNDISLAGLTTLGKMLAGGKLQVLKLSNNAHLTSGATQTGLPEALQAIGNAVQELWLNNCGLGVHFATALAETLSGGGLALHTLAANGNAELGGHLGPALAALSTGAPKLQVLQLECVGLSDALAAKLGACALAELSVAHNSLGDATATALGSVPSLTKLNLFNTKLGAAGVQALVSAGAKLGVASKLEAVDIGGNGLDDDGIMQLAAALGAGAGAASAAPPFPALKSLDVFAAEATPDTSSVILDALAAERGITVGYKGAADDGPPAGAAPAPSGGGGAGGGAGAGVSAASS